MGPLLKGPIYSSVPTYLLTYVSTATSLHIYRYLATYLPILTYIYRYLPAYLPLLTCTTISTSTYDEELGHKLFRPVRWLPFSHIVNCFTESRDALAAKDSPSRPGVRSWN